MQLKRDVNGFLSDAWPSFRRKIAPILTDRNKMKHLIADKAYVSKVCRKKLEGQHIEACISLKTNEKNPAAYDTELYKTRHIIENMFSK